MLRHTHFKLLFITLFVLMTAGLALAGPDQPPTEPPPARPFDKSLTDIPFLELNEPSAPNLNTEAVSVLPWSKVVYQSLRDGNWEIYSGNDDGTNQARLTTHGAIDAYPRLNRGGTRLVFASNRNGNYHIFVMNADGTGLAQLTFGNTNNINPSWSPDGSRILYESTGASPADIYVMNANGSNQTRLTDSPDYDGQPAWSPDGTKIAFVSRRTGGYRIYVMNADGSNQTQRSNQAYSFRPSWSPNGLWLAYDADGNGDGWQELWIMNVDGSGQYAAYDPPESQTDTWVGSWSPDSRFVSFTRISFIFFQGNWYWTAAFIDAWFGQTGNFLRLSPEDTNWNPDWQTLDLAPPQSQVSSLPAYARIYHSQLNWSGSDVGPAGIANYDIQYRVGPAGAWTDWLNATSLTNAPFPAVSGANTYFRSRAHDWAGNTESWPSQADTSTTFYTWQLAGELTDNRQAPLGGVPLSISPAPLYPAQTNGNGRYFTLLQGEGLHTFQINRPGYTTVQPTTLNIRSDQAHSFYLPPQDNQVANGTFEADNQLTNWNVNGILPATITTTVKNTGSRAASAGLTCPYPCFGEPELFLDAVHAYPEMVADSSGNLHVVLDYYDTERGIFYSVRSQDGVWSTPYKIGISEPSYIHPPHLAIDAQDTLYLIWRNEPGIQFSRKTVSGQWTTPVQILSYGEPVDLAVDSRGGLHILFVAPALQHLERTPQGVWKPPVQVNEGNNYPNGGVVLAVGPDNSLYVVWQETYSEPSDDHLLLFRMRLPDGTWAVREELYTSLNHFFTNPMRLTADSFGNLHLLWDYRDFDVITGYHSIWHPSTGWATPLPIPYHDSFDIVADSQGALHLVTQVINDGVYYQRYQPGYGWLDTVKLMDGVPTSAARITIDAHDVLNILHEDFWTGIQLRPMATATISGTTTLEQALTIPASSYWPTLAFRYRLLGSRQTNASGLTVRVSNGLTETVTVVQPTTSAWSHHWLDMQTWQGQTVTLTFQLHQAAGEPYLRLYLDDVSLGSTYPDLRITTTGGTAAFPGEQVNFALHYANQGLADATDTLITATLPAGLTFVSATIPPIATSPALVWDTGDLPASSAPFTIEVTATVAPSAAPFTSLMTTVQISAASPEVETANNTVQLTTFIGRRLYLPAIAR